MLKKNGFLKAASFLMCMVLVMNSYSASTGSITRTMNTSSYNENAVFASENDVDSSENDVDDSTNDYLVSKADGDVLWLGDLDESSLKDETKFLIGTAGKELESLQLDENNVFQTAMEQYYNGDNPSSDDRFINEKGEITEPFDVAKPEIFENGDVVYGDDAILVKISDRAPITLTEQLAASGVGRLEKMFSVENYTWYKAALVKDANVNETIEQVRALDYIAVAEYNYKYDAAADNEVQALAISNPMANEQWTLNDFNVYELWSHMDTTAQLAGGSSDVVVAVIDTGVDYTHQDLKSNIWVNHDEIPDNDMDDDGNGYVDDYYGVDLVNGIGSGSDDNGHGTHVAGIIAASNNDIGIVGLAYNTKVLPIKAGDSSGYFMQDNIAKAVIYAYEQGADVINMSFGGSASSIAVQDALAVANNQCVLVASAGNDGMPNEYITGCVEYGPNYPAALSYVIGVMSSDRINNESNFTNYDAKAFNEVEYDVYAPGAQILSTIPGDKYATMSGTSMAAPFVAAQAALLRSYYKDPSIYSSKFIYGQIVGTADQHVNCIHNFTHATHGRVNMLRSFTELPKPDIAFYDYKVFDTETFPSAGELITPEQTERNNSDGIVDAGETVALGMILRNKWGASGETTVHLEALTDDGSVHPYVTILNNDISYGQVGTYSTQDCGKVYEGDKWNGWENPFYIQVADNCPNDLYISFRITITYTNGINLQDESVYTTTETVKMVVRRGIVLPNNITEDMTLTKDHYYIIPNATYIQPGVTVRVEPGTQIQFWCSDPQDTYAETAITYLKVGGRFICEGTEEEPIEIFPSGWMDRYRVEIYEESNGYDGLDDSEVSLSFTNVTNPYIDISSANNCEFKQNYKEELRYREYASWNNKVEEYTCDASILISEANECVFYKLGGPSNQRQATIGGSIIRCMFVDCAFNMSVNNNNVVRDCVFYGNNNYGVTEYENGYLYESGTSSTINLNVYDNEKVNLVVEDVYTDNAEGFAYLLVNCYHSAAHVDKFMKSIGGAIVNFDEKPHYPQIARRFSHITSTFGGYNKDGKIVSYNLYETTEMGVGHYLCEIPVEIYVENIFLDEYVVGLDMASTHQINAELQPKTASLSNLIYESLDESIATVSETGLITPVTAGTTEIRVYSPDRAVFNYVTVNVTDEVIPKEIAFRNKDVKIEVGETYALRIAFVPSNATKRQVTYTSSDDSIASINEDGVVTALKPGLVTITAKGYNDIQTELIVKCVIAASSVNFENNIYTTTLTKDDGNEFYPVISPANTTETELVWEFSDESIAYVDENGKLVKVKDGKVELKATVAGTDLSDECTVLITKNELKTTVKKIQKTGQFVYALTEDSFLWVWGYNSNKGPVQLSVPDCIDFIADGNRVFILDAAKCVQVYYVSISESDSSIYLSIENENFLTNIKFFSESTESSNSYFAVDSYGIVWAWGTNYHGQLGNGTKEYQGTPSPIDFPAPIVKIVSSYYHTTFMDENGNVYRTGSNDGSLITPQLIESGADDIYGYNSYSYIVKDNVINTCYSYNNTYPESTIKVAEGERIYDSKQFVLNDGKLYAKGYQQYGELGIKTDEQNIYEYQPVIGAKDITNYFVFGEQLFVQTTDGGFYSAGNNVNHCLGTVSNENTVNHLQPVLFGFNNQVSSLKLVDTNMDYENNLYLAKGDYIEFKYNAKLVGGSNYALINVTDEYGQRLPIKKEIIFNKLRITPMVELDTAMKYNLQLPEDAFRSMQGSMSTAYTLNFMRTYDDIEPENPDDTQQPIEDEEEVVHEAIVNEELLEQRHFWSREEVMELWNKYVDNGHDTLFYSNVILNRLQDGDNTDSWLRFTTSTTEKYVSLPLGGNYWGTTDEFLINQQIIDFDDYQMLVDLNEGEYLTEAPTDTFPYVVDAYLMLNNERVDVVGNDMVSFVVNFNRPMDTSIPLAVSFGNEYPYDAYRVSGEYVSDTQWMGSVQLNTLIENGYMWWNVSNGKAAGTSLKFYTDHGRFPFKIDTSYAQAMSMYAEANETCIKLTWTQDDFETLAGYNVYRSTSEDGQYVKLNKTVIPADVREWEDTTIEPGQLYYYNFTVVESDLSESEPSGKISVYALDTMAPNIYHSPIYSAFTNNNLVISATIMDNVTVQGATVYYREKGQTEYQSIEMLQNNSKYQAVIRSQNITVAGLEYYIVATDGRCLNYSGTAEQPHEVMIQVSVADNAMGDVDGNGIIELMDGMMLLMAINDRINLDPVQFARADLDKNGELSAKEAMRIIQYVNGTINSVL